MLLNHKFSCSQVMLLSTAIDDKKIYLWDEKVCSTIMTYEDSQAKSNYNQISVAGSNFYSDYFYAITNNKSLISLYNTSIPDPIQKSSPTDEAVTTIEISDNLLILGTIKGNVFLFDITSGNITSHFQSVFTPIIDIQINLDMSAIVIMSSDSLKIYTLYDILSLSKLSSSFQNNINELSGLQNKDKSYTKSIVVFKSLNQSLILLYGKEKISIYNFPMLTNNYFNCFFKEGIVSVKQSLIDINTFYIATEDKEIYRFNLLNYLNNNKNDGIIIDKSKLELVIKVDHSITCMEIGANSVIIGMENKEVHLFSIIDFKFTSKFCQMKGIPNSIKCIFRPISQFGLNTNLSFKTKEVRKLEKIHNSTMKQVVSIDPVYNNYIDNIIDELI